MGLLRFVVSVIAVSCSVVLMAQEKKSITEKTHDIQEVVVTGTGTRHLLKDAPVETQVITRKMLESYGGASLQDILSGLTANFEFNEGDMGSQMQMNGLGNSYILILIDGKRMHGDVGGENDLGLIDPHNIEKIEIVRGAHSALYGSDAIAGVVNIITKNREQNEGLLLENTTRYGSYNDIRQHNGIGFRIGNVQSYTNFQLQHTDGWQNSSTEQTEGHIVTDSKNMTVNKYTNYQIAERLTYTPRKNLELYAEGSYYWKRIYRPEHGNYPSCDVYTYDLKYKNSSASVGGKMKLNDTDVLTLDIDWNRHAYYYAFTNLTFTDGYNKLGEFITDFPYFEGQQMLQSDQQRLMGNLKGIFQLPANNRLSAGMEYRYDYLNAPMRVIGGNASDWTAAAYVQDEYAAAKWLNITAGLRLNENGSFGFRATPKISSMLSAGDFRFRMEWSQGFKSPTPKEINYHYVRKMGSYTYYYMGNENLKAQTSNYYSANVEYRNNRFSASVTGYVNKLDNMITLVTVERSEIPGDELSKYQGFSLIPRKYMNMEDAKTYGMDVNTSYAITKELNISLSYSYLNTKAHVYDLEKEMLNEVIIDGMAHHRGTLNASYNHRFCDSYRLGININGRVSSKRYYQTNGDGKGYQLWRLSTSHDIGKAKSMAYRLEAGIDNIFNYRDTTMHGLHLGTTNPGRTFYATFSVRFNNGKSINYKIKLNQKQHSNEED